MCHERMISVRARHSLLGPDLLGGPQLPAPRVMNCQLSLVKHPPSLMILWLSIQSHVDVYTIFTTIVKRCSKAHFQLQSWRQRLSRRLEAPSEGFTGAFFTIRSDLPTFSIPSMGCQISFACWLNHRTIGCIASTMPGNPEIVPAHQLIQLSPA
jgi:hypothetical protein